MTSSTSYFFLKMQAVLLLVFGCRGQALSRFEHMLQLRPGDPYALASYAHLQAQNKNFASAITALHQLTAARPQDAAAWFNLGYVTQQAGRQLESEPAFRLAVGLDPQMDRAWYGLALVMVHQQRWKEAVEALKKNTALQPMSPYGWYQLARVHQALGQTDDALKVIAHLRCFEPKVAAQFDHEREAQAHAAC
jgi:Flp pilus assembly protein TadD